MTVVYAGTNLLYKVSSVDSYFAKEKPNHKAFRASEGVKASRIQVIVMEFCYSTNCDIALNFL